MQGGIQVSEFMPRHRYRSFSWTVGINHAHFRPTGGAPGCKTFGAGFLPTDNDHPKSRWHLAGIVIHGTRQHMPVSRGQADPGNALLLA